MTTPLIELRDVSKKYGDGPPALDSLSLEIRAGEALAVLGPSGSGKSTLLNLIAGLTVLDNVLLPAQLAGMPRRSARDRAEELLTFLGVHRHARAFPGRLSGGERQRVAVARALMNRPPLLLADEPTGALDTASGQEVRELLTELNKDGQTVLLVTHDLALAEACATRTIQLVDGRMVNR